MSSIRSIFIYSAHLRLLSQVVSFREFYRLKLILFSFHHLIRRFIRKQFYGARMLGPLLLNSNTTSLNLVVLFHYFHTI